MGFWEITLIIVLFILGLALIIKGGDFFVDAASWIAEKSGIPKFIIGATIVSIATTLPELIASITATAQGSLGIAIGNAVGSVTANTGLIMGISIIAIPAVIDRKQYWFKSCLLILISFLLWFLPVLSGDNVFELGGTLKLWHSIILFILFGLFIYENIRTGKKEAEKAADLSKNDEEKSNNDNKLTRRDVVVNILKFVFGAAGIVFGARLLVDNGQKIAELLGVSDAIIGLTLVAIGTSLPELVTTITAIVKKQSSLSVGNIIGANIIDMAIILPICSFVQGGSLPVTARTLNLDIPVLLVILAIALIPTLIRNKFSRVQGVSILAIYLAYVVYICLA